MKPVLLIFLIVLTVFLGSCKKDPDPDPTSTATRMALITATNWQLDRLTDASGKVINPSQTNLTTQVLFGLDFQFRSDNIVRAIDRTTKQIVNGGDWKFADENTAVDVNVTGFKGKFPIGELTRQKLVLKNKIPVNGIEQEANLEFKSSI